MGSLARIANRALVGAAFAVFLALSGTAAVAADLGPAIQTLLTKAADTPPAVKGDTSGPELLAFYRERNFQPIWLEGEKASKRARELLAILASARADGLEPVDYAVPRLTAMIDAAANADAAQLDVLLSFAAVHFGNDLAAGRIDPSTIDSEFLQHPEKIPPGTLIRDVVGAPDLKAFYA